jgi:PIN domain nuclease of toxin-antitoxin system
LSAAYLDTHVAVFLHDGLLEELSAEAKRLMEANDLLISPMVFFELDYLHQRKKIGVDAKALFGTLNVSFGVSLCPLPFAQIAHEAVDMHWTMDPFDRLIVAHAKANRDALLITRDRLIRRHYPRAIW